MSARIEKLIGIASLQGVPLTGYRRFGVPPGGAFDQESLRLGNALVGNDPGALALELSNASAEIVFSASTQVAVVGGSADNSCFDVAPGETLSIPAPRQGMRTYVCVVGGWSPEGIESPLARAGRVLSAGEVLLHQESRRIGTVQRLASPPASLTSGTLRVIGAGLDHPLRVSNSSDRTGIRLDGLPPREVPELPSEPACVGAVQLTSSGQAIVIGPDGPTIGGYPKIAFVCSADLDRLAHLRPGQEVEFDQIDLEIARHLMRERESRLARTIAQINIGRSR